MRYLTLLFACIQCTVSHAQLDSSSVPYSGNGWYMSPQGTIRLLVLFCEIEYDKEPNKDPQPDGAEHWPKGQLPTWKDDLFDPFAKPIPTAMVTRYYHDISLGRYMVLGDYIDKELILRESEFPEVRSAHGVGAVAVKEANKMGELRTRHGLGIADFDMWQDGGKAGLPKVNEPDEPHRYDHVMVIARNSGLTHGQGSTDQGSPGRLFGYESDTQSRFGGMNALPFEILKHEYNHLLLGGNNFHSGGGNAAQFDSHTLCIQGGWSMMGAASSSLLTCCGWDRYRLGWAPANAPYAINARNAAGIPVSGDLDPLSGDTGVFVLGDFITTGDALRLKMPFLPEGETRQWLWIENHQTYSRNGSPTDRFHWENTGATCLSKAEPGLFMVMQLEHEERRGPGIFGGSADYLHPLTASGHYDVVITDDTIQSACPFNGTSRAYSLKAERASPLAGSCEEELVVFDRNKDGRIERSEHLVMGSGYRPDGNLANDAAFFGAARHAWRANGQRVLGLSTNPSSANMLTLGCSGKKEKNKGKAPDNRTIYLNGMLVELVEQRAQGDIVVRVSTGATTVEKDVRWCADSIVLPPLRGADGRSMTVAKGVRVKLDRSLTPTRMELQGEERGTRWFAPPTRFTVSSGATVLFEPNTELGLSHATIMHVLAGASVELHRTTKLKLEQGSRIMLHGDAQFIGRARTLRKAKRKGHIVQVP